MSDGNKGGQIPNWLTDLPSQIEWVAKPLRLAINLRHNDDLLHSNYWERENQWNKEQQARYSLETTLVCVSVYLCLSVLTPSLCISVFCFCNFVYTTCHTSEPVSDRRLQIPGCNILISRFMLHIRPTISLANEVWNELWEWRLVQCMYKHSKLLHLLKWEARRAPIYGIVSLWTRLVSKWQETNFQMQLDWDGLKKEQISQNEFTRSYIGKMVSESVAHLLSLPTLSVSIV